MTPIRLKLAEARARAGLSQARLAKRLGVRQATISDLERGKTQRIDLELLERLCVALDVDPQSLFIMERAKPARRKRRG